MRRALAIPEGVFGGGSFFVELDRLDTFFQNHRTRFSKGLVSLWANQKATYHLDPRQSISSFASLARFGSVFFDLRKR